MRLNVGVLGVVLLIVWSCNATLMSIDLGTEYLKVAAPKGTSIDVCLNEQSHRKSDTWIGFRGDDRFFGADARNFAPRFPDFMIPAVPRLVGVPYTSHTNDRTATWLADMHYTFPVTTNTARGSLNVSRYTPTPSNPHPPSFSADELMGMLFGYVKDQAERELSSPVRDAVLVVPSGFDSRQRQALVDAAAISGIRVLTFVHPTTAAVLQLGLQNRGFGESSVHVMMYDMGASKTEAAVYRIDPPRTDKDGSRLGGALGTITLMGSIAADMTLGGRTIDACLAEYLEDEYIKSHPKGRRVLRTKEQLTEQDRKSVASLMRAANRAKEMLSANRDAPVTVEGIEVGRDYSTRVTRATFETRCASLWERALRVRDAALTSAKVSLSSLDRFEVVGGGLRVPTLLERLSAGYHGGTVDRTLNSDEAMVVGAGYFGAALSGHFRMKTFKVVESLGRSVFASLTFENGTSTEERLLFSPTTKLPTRLRLRWNHTVGKTSVIIAEGIEGGVRHKSSTTVVDVEKECSRFARHTNVTTSLLVDVRASEAGMVYVEKVVLDVHYFKNATRTVRITAKNDTLESGNASANVTNHTTGDTAYDANESGAQPDSSPQEDGMITDEDIPAPLDVAMTKQKPAEFAVETYYQARHQAVGMQTHTDFLSTPLPMSKEESLISRDLLRAMRQRDLLLLQRSAARNDLEAYIIWGLGDGFAFNTESHRLAGASEADVDGALTKLRDIQAWLEESGDNASTEELSAKLRQAKLIVRVALRDGEHTTQVEGVSVSEQEESALDADADMEDEL